MKSWQSRRSWSTHGKRSIRPAEFSAPLWSSQSPCTTIATLIAAGDTVVAGGEGQVVMLEGSTGKTLWSADVQGTACDLAVAGGRLFVSTDRGEILCFAGGPAALRSTAAQPAAEEPPAAVEARAAEDILRRTGVTQGYCLDLACGDGRLAPGASRRSALHVYAVEADADKARRRGGGWRRPVCTASA